MKVFNPPDPKNPFSEVELPTLNLEQYGSADKTLMQTLTKVVRPEVWQEFMESRAMEELVFTHNKAQDELLSHFIRDCKNQGFDPLFIEENACLDFRIHTKKDLYLDVTEFRWSLITKSKYMTSASSITFFDVELEKLHYHPRAFFYSSPVDLGKYMK